MKSIIGQEVVSINGRDDAGDTLAHKGTGNQSSLKGSPTHAYTHTAAIHGQLECLLWLVQNGADGEFEATCQPLPNIATPTHIP